MPYDQIPSDAVIAQTVQALQNNGITVHVAPDRTAAKQKLLELLPPGAEVMTMTSVTLDAVSAVAAVNESGTFTSVRNQVMQMDRATQGREMQRLGAAPTWAVGSAHAVTQDGHVIIASNTGSQLPAYAYGADHVVWIVGAQKIVNDTADGMRRIYEHTLPLESARAKIAYGVPGSAVNKLLIVNAEVKPGRITVIIVKEKLGF